MSTSEVVAVHEEVKLSEMEFDEELEGYLYDCPCGDEFYISTEDLKKGLNIAECPSCSLKLRVLFNLEEFLKQFIKESDKPQSNNDFQGNQQQKLITVQ
eukprot:CAMPEP_0201581180 /NCGR_PEP_ID=MMETSP0190_2-20130828/64372_1 /ASSEMBLY_ACC=CAM_ASM_000263 /TAXON_ID=37353 /ORGANISM="Rosalina sp." /LENGTH=98 /DNA_ID=CAMNT_0048018615 /DNA_START=29 /DNA_END=325 /DNA_ORIENTATION=+